MRCIEISISRLHLELPPRINRNMRCIEISETVQGEVRGQAINRNMRCIEIAAFQIVAHVLYWLIETWDVLKCYRMQRGHDWKMGLIETWDVLKYDLAERIGKSRTINRNMRCIEISKNRQERANSPWINRNMRCIEMWFLPAACKTCLWLIETWDVLKST